MNIEYANAFAETLYIVKCLPYNEQKKIPKKLVEYLDKNKNDKYQVKINPSISLQNQNILDITKALLKEIYIFYFASKNERDRITEEDSKYTNVENDIKNKDYNVDSLFNNEDMTEGNEDVLMIKYKESIFKKMINKIKSIFSRV